MLKKNTDYQLRHVDRHGYGILFATSSDECLFLNPVATDIWTANSAEINPYSERSRISADTGILELQEYIDQVIDNMRVRRILLDTENHASSRDQESSSAIPEVPALSQLYFYTTRRCNARCYHCYQPVISADIIPLQEELPDLSTGEFLKFAGKAQLVGLQHVKLTGGEPLLRSDLGDLIEGLSSMQIKVSVETNAFLLDESMADLFAEHDVDVSISLDGGSASVHDKLRRFPGSFERATRAISLLSNRGADPKVIMSISKLNLGEIDKVIAVAREKGSRLIKINPVNTLGIAKRLAPEKVLLSVDQIQGLYLQRNMLESKYNVFLYLEGPPAFGSIADIVNGHSASCPFTHILGVLSDGSLSFCGVGNSCPELIFANVRDNSFDVTSYWRDSVELARVRNVFAIGLEGVCGHCLLSQFCKGSCRALAYGDYGSFSAPHPWCQHAYEMGNFPVHFLKHNTGGTGHGRKYRKS